MRKVLIITILKFYRKLLKVQIIIISLLFFVLGLNSSIWQFLGYQSINPPVLICTAICFAALVWGFKTW